MKEPVDRAEAEFEPQLEDPCCICDDPMTLPQCCNVCKGCIDDFEKAEQQRDDLLAAAKDAEQNLSSGNRGEENNYLYAKMVLQKAIAKAEGE